MNFLSIWKYLLRHLSQDLQFLPKTPLVLLMMLRLLLCVVLALRCDGRYWHLSCIRMVHSFQQHYLVMGMVKILITTATTMIMSMAFWPWKYLNIKANFKLSLEFSLTYLKSFLKSKHLYINFIYFKNPIFLVNPENSKSLRIHCNIRKWLEKNFAVRIRWLESHNIYSCRDVRNEFTCLEVEVLTLQTAHIA